MSSPLLDKFGYLSEEENSQQVIQGTYVVPPGTSEYLIEFLDIIQIPS